MEQQSMADQDIAIIGTSCRVAGANSPTELWKILASSKDAQSEITRFNARGFYHPQGGPFKGLTCVKDGYMLDNDLVDRFDNTFFRIAPPEAVAIDPQQRMLLEIAYEAVENAGFLLDEFIGSDTGVYAGMEGSDYHTILARNCDATPKYLATGTAGSFAANRISYFFNLSGPSIVIDSACSSSMSALHQAVTALQRSECKMALICGAKLILNPDMFIPSTELGFLSPDGRCKTFDAEADGYGRGEGVLALLIRPLEDAIRCNDPVRAIIKGTRLNQDGRTQGITLPSSTAQQNNMIALYKRLSLSPDDIQYIEAHGTGTCAGDSLEVSAINAVFKAYSREKRVIVGSVKSNIGHLESCSALAGIIKVVESMERAQIPPQMNLKNLNPNIDFSALNIPTKILEWPQTKNGVRLAAINSFGAGGTNGHAVLQGYDLQIQKKSSDLTRPLLFKISAHTENTLIRMKDVLVAHCESEQPDLRQLAYTLSSRRSTMAKTIFFTAQNEQQLLTNLESQAARIVDKANGKSPKIILVFTGQGAQWPCMGKELLVGSPLFNSIIAECQSFLDSLPDGPDWSISEELTKCEGASNIYKSAFSQPLCTILQLGLVEILRFWGFAASAVVGHSSGEIAAAYAAGMISLRDAVVIAYYRGLHLGSLATNTTGGRPKGSMCAVSIDKEGVNDLMSSHGGRVQIAAINAPNSYTLSGDAEAVHSIVQDAKRTGIFCRELRVDTAFHSFHVVPAMKRYGDALCDAGVSFAGPTKCPMFSSVMGSLIKSEDLTPAYWSRNMIQTVLFSQALTECLQSFESMPVCLEIGPHPVLKAPTIETARSMSLDSSNYFASCLRGKHDFVSLLESVIQMMATGVKFDLLMVNNIEDNASALLPRVLTNLPPYPWDHSTPFWYETDVSRHVRFRKHRRHLLLGSRALQDSSVAPCWRNHLRLDEIPFLEKLQAEKSALDVRYALYLIMILEAARQIQTDYYPGSCWHASEVKPSTTSIIQSVIGDEQLVNLHLNTHDIEGNGEYIFQVLGLGQRHSRECSGKLQFNKDKISLPGNLVKIVHNRDLLTASEWLGFDTSIPTVLTAVKISAVGCEGRFDSIDRFQDCACHELEILQAILCIIPVSTSTSLLPGKPKMTSIGTLSSPSGHSNYPPGYFHVSTETLGKLESSSTINIFFRDYNMTITDLVLQHDRAIVSKAPLRALFSKQIVLPDISKHGLISVESLQHLIDLVIHKWPMADVGIAGFANERALRTLLSHFARSRRASYRSIAVEHPGLSGIDVAKIRFTDSLSSASGLHLLFLGDNQDKELDSILHPRGIICAPASSVVGDSCEVFARFKSIEGEEWLLHRRASRESRMQIPSSSFIFTDRSLPTPEGSAPAIRLSPSSVKEFCASHSDRYHAVVVESSEKSVVTSWEGKNVVPWLQHMMHLANSIIWVTQSWRSNPFHGTVGILLRTLQAESPALKVMWITCGEYESDESIMDKIQQANSAFKEHENEIKYDWQNGTPYILRYLPDDLLSARVGLAPPMDFDLASECLDDHLAVVEKERRTSLLNPNGSYVIVGGLGGLGRYVCSWMASHGAKSLMVISRSGTASTEAQKTVEGLRSADMSVQVYKADASDEVAVRAILDKIRQQGPIRGVINLAMVLADVPFAVMTNEQWDMTVRLKVDSSWILHSETLNDELDFFVLFSSVASILGNRNQANYNVGNAFLNTLAEYRHSLGLTAVSIALGAMTEIGVLHEAGMKNLLHHLSRSGLTALTRHELGKILEAAIIESSSRERPVILTGLEMLERVNGKIVGSQDQTQLIWTEFPELSHLQNHKLIEDGTSRAEAMTLSQRLELMSDRREINSAILKAFFKFLAQLQGFDESSFDPIASLSSFGLDSLGAVSCQFWFHRELGVSISAGEVLNSTSLAEVVELASERVDK